MIQRLKVALRYSAEQQISVGEMLRTASGEIFFQFSPELLKSGIALSPFKLKQVAEPQKPNPTEAALFDGLFGVFADSLPDGWGLLMMSRAMRRVGIDFRGTSALDRLAFVGSRGIGALIYEPEIAHGPDHHWDLAELAANVEKIVEGVAEDVLPELLELGGSPGGARPKILIGLKDQARERKPLQLVSGVHDLKVGFEHWMLKFRGKGETSEASILEYIYALTAKSVGIIMTDCKLIEDRNGQSWFATKRFDRSNGDRRVHTQTVAGLLHANFRLPSLDYEDLLKLTWALTKHHADVLAMFKLACFNVLFHNRDDHAKNFSFVMSERGIWRLGPAYDLTFTTGPAGEHTTSICGEGRRPGREHCLKLAEKAGIDARDALNIWDEVESGKSFMKAQLRKYKLKSKELSAAIF